MTKPTLVIVDVQKDFIEGGSLGVEGGTKVARDIAAYVEANGEEYGRVVASRDFHLPDSDNGGHFSAVPDFSGTWPAHCVQGTRGAEFANELEPIMDQVTDFVVKGAGKAAYSVLEGHRQDSNGYGDLLFTPGEIVDVCGIATDYCVKATVLDLLRAGCQVNVLPWLCAGVTEETSKAALIGMQAAGAFVVGQFPRRVYSTP